LVSSQFFSKILPDEHQIHQLKTTENIREFIDLADNFYPTLTLDNGDVYTGPVNHLGQREGYGLLVLADKSYYLGNWMNDKANGRGTHKALDSAHEFTVSRGEWKNN
jgi:hypothetical protein